MPDMMGRGIGPAAFSQAASAPASAALVTVPVSVKAFRTVYGSASLTDAATMTIEVETAVGSGAYSTVLSLIATAGVDAYSTGYSFMVAPGRRYRFTMVGDAVITVYSYMDM